MIRLKNIRVLSSYASAPILAIDDLVFEREKNYIITGASGAGKSSLLYTLAGMQHLCSGQVFVSDVDIYQQSQSQRDRWRLHNIGFIFQDFHLIDELNPLENVIISQSFHGFIRKQDITWGQRLLFQLGITEASKNLSLFSRGEKQRIAIARAFFRRAPIILADEPTASLDKQNARQICHLLWDLCQNNQSQLIAVSHDPIFMEFFKHKYHLNRGKVEEM